MKGWTRRHHGKGLRYMSTRGGAPEGYCWGAGGGIGGRLKWISAEGGGQKFV